MAKQDYVARVTVVVDLPLKATDPDDAKRGGEYFVTLPLRDHGFNVVETHVEAVPRYVEEE